MSGDIRMGIEYLEGEILILRNELYQLKGVNQEQEVKIQAQLKIINELTVTNTNLQNQLARFKDKLNINSSNSGLPTSRDIYRIERKSRPSSGRKAGGQAGHEFKGYKFKVPDKIIDIGPKEASCECGGELILSEDYKAHQKIEIPEIKPFVTEYRLRAACCSVCARKYNRGLEDYKLLGKNAESIITSLGGFFNNSKREIQSILSQIFNLDVSLGLISSSEDRVSKKLESKYNELMDQAENSKFLHLDETSSNNKGKKHWCWVAASSDVTVFKLAKSRGKKPLEEFLPEYQGKVISDRYAVYNMFDREKRQVCLAHLRRDFKRFAHSTQPSLSKLGQTLLDIIDLVFDTHKVFIKKEISYIYYLRRIRKLKKKMLYYLKTISNLENCKQAKKVASNILKTFDMMWLFVHDKQIEPTNNFAERQIKNFVKYRKNSFFTWSNRGERFLERVKSIFATAKLNNLNPQHQISILL